MTTQSLINRFLSHLRQDGKSVLTLSAYATDLKQFSCICPTSLTSITPSLLTAHCLLLTEKLSPNSRARKLTTIREFLRWCYRKGYMHHNIAETIDLPKRNIQHSANPLTPSQIARLRRFATPLQRLLLELLLQTGMKLKDILSLQMKQVNMTHQVFHHPVSFIAYPVSGHLHQALSYYLETRTQQSSGFLLLGTRRKKLSTRTATQLLAHLSKKAHVRQATPRNLRVTFIAHQMSAGIPVDTLQQALGLQTLAPLQKYLAHSSSVSHNRTVELAEI